VVSAQTVFLHPWEGSKPGHQWVPTCDHSNSWVFLGDDGSYLPCMEYEYSDDPSPPQGALVVPNEVNIAKECNPTRGQYAGSSALEPNATCAFDVCPWATGFVLAGLGLCRSQDLPGCNATCARAKCEQGVYHGRFSDLGYSYFHPNFLCTLTPVCPYRTFTRRAARISLLWFAGGQLGFHLGRLCC